MADDLPEGPPSKRQRGLAAQLRSLNEQFAGWVQEQKANHINDVWIDGAEDYIMHARSILKEVADSVGSECGEGKPKRTSMQPAGQHADPGSTNQKSEQTNGLFGFKLPGSAAPPAATASHLQPTLAWGGLQAGSKPAATAALLQPLPSPINFLSSNASQPGSAPLPFSFSGSSAALQPNNTSSAAASTPLTVSFPALPAVSFGQDCSSSPAHSNGSAFGWGSASASGTDPKNGDTGGTAIATGGEDAGGDEDVPDTSTSEVQLGSDSHILFKEPAKLFLKKPGAGGWDDRGQGTLTVRQDASSSDAVTTFVVFTTDTGRILVNGAIYKGIPLTTMKKPNNVLTNLTLAMEEKAADMPVKLTTMLFRLDHADKAANFVSVVEDAKLK